MTANRYKLLRYFAYTVEILVLFMVQQTPGLLPEVAGARPVLLIPAAVSIAVFESETAAMGFGLFCGLLLDFGMTASTLGFHAILLTIVCYCCGVMVINLLRTSLFTDVLLSAGAAALIFLLQWVFYFILYNYQYSFYALTAHLIPRFFYTLAFSPVFYYFNRAFALLIRERES